MNRKNSPYLLIALGLILALSSSCEGDDKNDDNTVQDIDGNVYKTVTIGTQIWMAENLKTTRFNDGTEISKVTADSEWNVLTTPGFCWYNNDSITYSGTYGALYNWYAVNSGKLCPTGWHVPNDAEWTTLTDYLGGDGVAGSLLKERGTIHWNSPNAGVNNLSGFTALPGGYRHAGQSFAGNRDNCFFWSSSEYNSTLAWPRYLYYGGIDVDRDASIKTDGFSVRCVKDN